MLVAQVDGERCLAEKLVHRTKDCRCPGCDQPVLARVGDERTPHWAHIAKSDCPVAAGETAWHLEWKALGRLEEIEVVQPEWPSNRADLFLIEGGLQQVVELQHSGITADTVSQREQAYRDVIWIVDVRGRAFSVQGDRYQWKRASQVWTCADQVIFDNGTTCYGRLAKATYRPEVGLLFRYMDTTGSVATLRRPAIRAELLAMIAGFKVAQRLHQQEREAERIEYELEFKEQQEAAAQANRDSWFRPPPSPPKLQWERDQEDLRRVTASLEAMQQETRRFLPPLIPPRSPS